MSLSYHGAKWIALPFRPYENSFSSSCLHALRRHYTPAVAVADIPEPSSSTEHVNPANLIPTPDSNYNIKAGVVLSRPPTLTRDLHSFEKAFYLYQKRLNERLALSFTRYFYYQQDTPQDLEWKRKIKARKTPARDIGIYDAYKDEKWNDEVLIGAKESEPEDIIEKLVKDSEVQSDMEGGEGPTKTEDIVERPVSRTTEADTTGDVKSLNRSLARTLFLLVKGNEGQWEFPKGSLIGRESLHRAAERILVQAGGLNMNTWIVGNAPVGHHSIKPVRPNVNERGATEPLGEKTFFMKVRLMAGMANIEDNSLGLTDFKWLAKEEVQKEVHPSYWNSVKNMLAER